MKVHGIRFLQGVVFAYIKYTTNKTVLALNSQFGNKIARLALIAGDN